MGRKDRQNKKKGCQVKEKRRKNRNGILLLEGEADFYRLFSQNAPEDDIDASSFKVEASDCETRGRDNDHQPSSDSHFQRRPISDSKKVPGRQHPWPAAIPANPDHENKICYYDKRSWPDRIPATPKHENGERYFHGKTKEARDSNIKNKVVGDRSKNENEKKGMDREWGRFIQTCDKVISHDNMSSPSDPYDIPPPSDTSLDGGKSTKRKRPVKKDRHGIPFLDGLGSLFRLFKDEKPEGRSTDDRNDAKSAKHIEASEMPQFGEMLASSLEGKGASALLREKRDKVLPTPIPLKKRLKRYPSPQQELDLHGFTAAQARARSESWVRRLWRNGFFTLRIIVGKGLHSEFGAVLPDVIEDLMVQLKQNGVVLWFEWDRKSKRKSGALIVYLKQFD